MKTIVIPQFYRGPSGQKGLYNRQEVGLARAFAALGCRAVVLYPEPGAKAPRIETPEPNVKICYMPAVAFGVQAFYKSWQILLDEHADAVHVMGDNSLGVPGLYRFCQKHGILFYSQLGALKSTSNHAAVRRVMDLLLILLLSLLAGGINPYGFRLYSQLAEIQRASKIIHITELSPPTLNLSASTFAAQQSSAAMILLLLLLVYLILCPHKIPTKNLLPVAMTGCMMLLHVRFIGWFFAALTIFILQEADRLLPICEVSNKHARPQCAILAAPILGSVLWCTFQFAPTAENARPIRYPSETLLEVIATQNPQHLYSSAIGTGTFFAYNGTPCFVDSRIELYPSEVLHDFQVLEGSVPYTDTTIDYFGPIIDKYQFDMMVLCQHDNVGLTAYMSQRSDWQLIYTSSVYAVFVPKT